MSTGLEHGRLHDAVGAKCGETLTVTIGYMSDTCEKHKPFDQATAAGREPA